MNRPQAPGAPRWGTLLLIGAFFHGLAPVANMNPARLWGAGADLVFPHILPRGSAPHG